VTSQVTDLLKCYPLTMTQAQSRFLHFPFDNGLFEVSPDLHQSLLQLSQVLASCTCDPACSPKSWEINQQG